MEDDEPVRLNIYDLGKSNTVQSLNGWLKPVGIGAFHCAVQVYGVEWSYGGWRAQEGLKDSEDSEAKTGIWSCLPQMSVDHTFREAVPMGSISMSEDETVELIYSLMEEWPMSEYDILNKNCCHFCEELCLSLGLGPLPSRVKKLAGLGATLNESAQVAVDQVFQVASKVKSDIVGAGYVATNLAVQAVMSGASALADAPRHLSDYLHRAGRTARYGEPGKVTSLVKKGDKALAKAPGRFLPMVQRIRYNAVIGARGRESRGLDHRGWSESLVLLELLVQRGALGLELVPKLKGGRTAWNFFKVISGCGKSGEWKLSHQTLEILRCSGILPTLLSFGAALTAITTGVLVDTWLKALHLYSQMWWMHLLPDLVAFNALGSAAAVSGQWLLMLRLMEDATKMRLQCDAITGTALVSACETLSAWQEGLVSWRSLRQDGMAVNLIQLNSVISNVGKGLCWDLAAELLQMSLQPDEVTLTASLAACCDAMQWDTALDCFLMATGGWSSRASVTALLGSLRGAQQWRMARHSWEQLQVSPDLPCVNELVSTSALSFHWPQALVDFHLLQELRLKTDTVALNSLLAAFLPLGKWQQIMLYLDDIRDLKGFCCVATCYARAAQRERLLALL
ncbi:unnamed protein product, partial [Cladocopium goreaui]